MKKYVTDFGIASYEALITQCERMGVVPPVKEDTITLFGKVPVTSDPSDGIIILSEPRIVNEDGKPIDDDPVEQLNDVYVISDERDLDVALNNADGEHVWPYKKKKSTSRNS